LIYVVGLELVGFMVEYWGLTVGHGLGRMGGVMIKNVQQVLVVVVVGGVAGACRG
jgi:hypothetical protein